MQGLRVPASLLLFLLAAVITVSEVNGKALASPEANPEPLPAGFRSFGGRGGFSQRPRGRPLNTNTNPKPQTAPVSQSSQSSQSSNSNNNNRRPPAQSQSHHEHGPNGGKKPSQSSSDVVDQLSDMVDQIAQAQPQVQEQYPQQYEDAAPALQSDPEVDIVPLDSNDDLAGVKAAPYQTD